MEKSAFSTTNKNRIAWIDLAKGIAMFLVIIGHTVHYGNSGPWITSAIYSFHMPLFFILSGLTFRPSSSDKEVIVKAKKVFLALIVPAILVYLTRIIIEIFMYHINFMEPSFFITRLYGLLFWTVDYCPFSSLTVYRIGRIWFLMTLFLGKTLIDYMQIKISEKQLPFFIIGLSFVGYAIGLNMRIFLSFETVLATLPFIFIGHLLKNYDFHDKLFKRTILYFIIWIVSFLLTNPDAQKNEYLDIATQRYPLYPLCFIPAIFGTLLLCNICVAFSKYKIFKPLIFIGKNSLYMLFAHALEFPFASLWEFGHNQYLRALVRILINIVIFFIIMVSRFIIQKIALLFLQKKHD